MNGRSADVPARGAQNEPNTRRYHARWHRWARFVAQRLVLAPVLRTFVDVTVVGAENLDGLDAPFVVVANHSSHLDAPLVVTTLPRRLTRDLAVGAAADYFYRSWWRKAAASLFFNTYPVGRTSGDVSRDRGLAVRLVAEDVPILIFPEGTRRDRGGNKRFKLGAAALCVSQAVPCVPVAIVGAGKAMPVGRWWPVPGRPPVTVLIGAPLVPEPDETVRAFNDRIAGAIAAMRDTGTPGPPGGDRAGCDDSGGLADDGQDVDQGRAS